MALGHHLRRADLRIAQDAARRRAAQPRSARAAARDAARPAVPDGARLRRAAAAGRPARRRHALGGRRWPAADPEELVARLPGAAGGAPLPRLDGRAHPGAVPAARRALRRPGRRTSGRTPPTARRCSRRLGGAARLRRAEVEDLPRAARQAVRRHRRRAGGRPPAPTARRGRAARSPTSTGPEYAGRGPPFKQEQKQAAKATARARSRPGSAHGARSRWHAWGARTGEHRGRPRPWQSEGWMSVASSQQFPRARRPEPGAHHRGAAEHGRTARPPGRSGTRSRWRSAPSAWSWPRSAIT